MATARVTWHHKRKSRERGTHMSKGGEPGPSEVRAIATSKGLRVEGTEEASTSQARGGRRLRESRPSQGRSATAPHTFAGKISCCKSQRAAVLCGTELEAWPQRGLIGSRNVEPKPVLLCQSMCDTRSNSKWFVATTERTRRYRLAHERPETHTNTPKTHVHAQTHAGAHTKASRGDAQHERMRNSSCYR